MATLVLTAIVTLAALGIIGASVGQSVAPGPMTYCLAVHAPAHCSITVNRLP